LMYWNVHGIVTIWPGKVNVLAVCVRVNQASIEKILSRDIPKSSKTGPGAQQLLFGARVENTQSPLVSVHQIGPGADLYQIPEVRDALNECLELVKEALNKP
jgi:hypothetical protein